MVNNYEFLTTVNWPLATVLCPLHPSRILYKFAPFFAKQTQFPECSNERNFYINKEL
jgi:hypothetical protein